MGLARKSDNKEGLHPCIGIGFVRAIDSQKGLVYLLSDLSQEALEEVDLLQVVPIADYLLSLKASQ